MELPIAAILAGGKSSRMGADKAISSLGGRAMFEHVADAVTGLVHDVVVIGRTGGLGSLRSVVDSRPSHRGPLAGLATAMRVSAGRAVFLVAVDQPLLSRPTVSNLMELARPDCAVVPIDGDSRQVTCAVYPAAWASEIDDEDAAGGSIQSLLDRLDYRPVLRREWEAWGEDGRSWRSIDTPSDLAAAAALLRDAR